MQLDIRPSITKEEINSFPLFKYDGDVRIVTDLEGLEEAVDHAGREALLGFDTETKPSFRKGSINNPALIQIACSDVVFLIQLRQAPFCDALAELLGDPSIIKSGVAIADDMRALKALHDFDAAGLADLSVIARKNGISNYSLRALSAIFLNVRISKTARCTNWNNARLSGQQVAYAATDAWISREIYLRMKERGFSLS